MKLSADAAPRARRRDIQGFRAIAVLFVVIFHAGLPVPGGFVGVDVFFTISGFVIGSALLAELQSSSTISLRDFYARRVRRLLPALAALLIFVVLAASFLASPLGPQQEISRTGTAASVFGANIQLFRSAAGYFDVSAESNALLHTWSLSVEEQFYVVFPSLMLIAWRLERFARNRVVLAVVAIGVSSFLLSVATTFEHGQQLAHALGGTATRFAFYMPLTRAWEFAVGVGIALSPSLARLPRVASNSIGVIGGCVVLFGALWIQDGDRFPGTLALLPVLGAGAIIVAGHDHGSIIARCLSTRPLVWIGDISYGWYLWHWPMIVFAKALWPSSSGALVVAAVVSLVPTVASYRWLETPLRRDTRIVGMRALLLALACIALPIGASLALREITAHERGTDAVQRLVEAVRSHEDESRKCNGGETEAISRDCTWPVANARGTIILIGDSNAGHFTEVAAKAANEAGYSFEVTTLPGCPFVDLYVETPRHPAAICHAFVERALRMLVRRHPALVIVGTASTTYLSSDARLRGAPSDHDSYEMSSKLQLWERGIQAALQPLGDASIPVVWIHAVPRIPGLEPLTCPYLVLRSSSDACSVDVDRAHVESEAAPVRAAEDRALQAVSSASGLDLTAFLCSPTKCMARRGDMWMFRDEGHLTVDGALTLAPQFRDLITEHARR